MRMVPGLGRDLFTGDGIRLITTGCTAARFTAIRDVTHRLRVTMQGRNNALSDDLTIRRRHHLLRIRNLRGIGVLQRHLRHRRVQMRHGTGIRLRLCHLRFHRTLCGNRRRPHRPPRLITSVPCRRHRRLQVLTMVKAVNPVGWNAIMVRIIRHRHRRHAVVTTEDGDNRLFASFSMIGERQQSPPQCGGLDFCVSVFLR